MSCQATAWDRSVSAAYLSNALVLTPTIPDLGASLYEIVHIVKANKERYKQIDLHYTRDQPLTAAVVLSLPQNGFRMRFDGPDQRLHLIEIQDFKKIRIAYKSSELMKDYTQPGPMFRRIYQIFGASYPGEYLPPDNAQGRGKYVLSWTGVAFDFSLQHSAYSPEKDHVSLLEGSAAGPATVMALFEGASWTDARGDLFSRIPSGPRLSANAMRLKDNLPAEIDIAYVGVDGNIELSRRAPASKLNLVLQQTTIQDLIMELGQPDATHKRVQDIIAQEPPRIRRQSNMSNGKQHASPFGSYSSTGTDTFDTDFDSGDADEAAAERAGRETFWSYFTQGMDILVGPPPNDATSATLVVLKVIIHGNVPGSYAFNRHRRLRWVLKLPDMPFVAEDSLSSESSFDQDLKPALLQAFANGRPNAEMGRGKVINRTWGGSGGDGLSESGFFLPDAEKDLVEGDGSEAWLGNTKLYTFPGLGWEVLDGGWVTALTVG